MKNAPHARILSSLRVLLVLAGFVLIATSELHAQYARGQLIPEVKLKNGTVLHDVTVVAVGSTTVTARWAGGRGSLALAQLPPDMRAALT
ncbi:MAG: hypothetical protein ABI222_04535, partial [Opitutaceae bacterium]